MRIRLPHTLGWVLLKERRESGYEDYLIVTSMLASRNRWVFRKERESTHEDLDEWDT